MRVSQLRNTGTFLVLGTVLATPVAAQEPLRTYEPALERTVQQVSEAAIRSHVAYLASDEMRGRATPSPELEIAAEYIAREFESYGLRPAGDSGSYLQRYAVSTFDIPVTRTRLALETGSATTEWRYGEDFFVVPSSAERMRGEPIFTGTAREAEAGLPDDVRSRIVVVLLPGEPGLEAFATIGAAAMVGAAGIVFVLDPALGPAAVHGLARMIEGGMVGGGSPIPAVGLRYGAAAELFAGAGMDLDVLRTADGGSGGVVLRSVVLSLEAPVRRHEHMVPNVAAVLRGADPVLRDAYVVVSAHFDHLGVGLADAAGDSVFNGADDNASGTAALLEVARAFSSMPVPPARSILFLAVSGEEKGLLGSAHFVEQWGAASGEIVANLNLDMVGIRTPERALFLVGAGGGLIDAATAGELTLRRDAPEGFRSDHLSFAARGIPAVTLTTGFHRHYHRASDRAEVVDPEIVAQVAHIVVRAAAALATSGYGEPAHRTAD
jgi:hypothetical protein